MTRNTKILLLGTGVTVAVGTLACFICKMAASRKKATEDAKQETDAAVDEAPAAVAFDAKEFSERQKEALQKRTEITGDEMTTNATDLTEKTEFVAEQA